MKRRINFYHRITGRKLADDVKRPNFDEIINKQAKRATTKYPLRLLGEGIGKGKAFHYMTEEEREVNFHIIGGSRQGKSKYLEYHIRQDISMGNGLCLIDPSDFGATFKAVLEYCASINHQKVCIINPATLYDYGKVACIQPLNAKFPTKSVSGVMDSVNILFNSSEANTPRIQENLKALLRMLAGQHMTLHEAAYFSDYEDLHWKSILENSKGSDVQIIKDKFKSYANWKNEFTTTVTRLGTFKTEPVSLMVGATEGIDFVKLIEEGWVILCNLFPEPYLDQSTSRFLGILIISQIIQAVDTLNDRKEGFDKKFYLYIDEAGRFATSQIENLLSYKSKSGLHLIFAHHHFSQFKNQDVLDAINHNTGIKIMFNLRDNDDRIKMIKQLGFGGEISPQEAAHRYRNLPKRHFLLKKNKENAVEVRTPNIERAFVTDAGLESYIRERLQDSWYLPKYEIQNQIKQRIKPVDNEPETNDTIPLVESAVSDGKTSQHPQKTGRTSLFDLKGEADEFIRNNKNSQKNGS